MGRAYESSSDSVQQFRDGLHPWGVKVIEDETDSEWAGLAEYVARRGDWLGRCAYLLTGNRETALDLVQDTLVRTWTAKERVATADDQDRYILRIMLNQFRSQHRRSRLSVVHLNHDAVSLPAAADATKQGDDAHLLAGALATLSQRQRAVVVLRYWADLDDQRIAEALGCRRATVRSIASRSMHKLKQHLESK